MEIEEQLHRIATKLARIRKLDYSYTLFGANKHEYLLEDPLPIQEIEQFERTHGVKLPEGYVRFLTTLGNGGAGPFYGLAPLEDCLFADLYAKRKDWLLDPSRPFPPTEPWNLKFVPTVNEEENEQEYDRQQTDFEEIYFDDTHITGVIAICDFGCAVRINLVVNGPVHGHVWTDDRGSYNGICPSCKLGNPYTITFLDWYELWLDNSIAEIRSKTPTIKLRGRKPWWKFW
jgi:hypothetical protein